MGGFLQKTCKTDILDANYQFGMGMFWDACVAENRTVTRMNLRIFIPCGCIGLHQSCDSKKDPTRLSKLPENGLS